MLLLLEKRMTKIYIFTVLLSLLPISELRGAIPFAYFNGVSLPLSFLIAVIANALVPAFGFIFLNTIHKLLYKWKFYQNFFDKTVTKARNKVGEKVSKYGLLGLILFVAIPLPITGAWTGTLGAWVLGLDYKKSLLTIATGVLIAGIIVSLVILTGSNFSALFTKTITI